MSYTVHTSRNAREKYTNAADFDVIQSHLYLQDKDQKTIAVYAPEHWRSVYQSKEMSAG